MLPPPLYYQFNRQHPLANGLVDCWHPGYLAGGKDVQSAVGINRMAGAGTAGFPTVAYHPVLGMVRDYNLADNQRLSVASNPSTQIGGISFSVVAWFVTDIVTASFCGIYTRDNGVGVRDFELYRQGNIAVMQIFGTGNKSAVTPAGTIAVGTLYCAVGWYDVVADTVNVQINNGTVYSTDTSGVSLSDTANTPMIGNTGSLNRAFDGIIGPVYFYKRVLSADERTQHFLDPHAIFRPVSWRIISLSDGAFIESAESCLYGLQTLVPGLP